MHYAPIAFIMPIPHKISNKKGGARQWLHMGFLLFNLGIPGGIFADI
jgi:hypothetical protein